MQLLEQVLKDQAHYLQTYLIAYGVDTLDISISWHFGGSYPAVLSDQIKPGLTACEVNALHTVLRHFLAFLHILQSQYFRNKSICCRIQ